MSGLHEAFDEIVARVPVYGDLDGAIEQAEQERRRRFPWSRASRPRQPCCSSSPGCS